MPIHDWGRVSAGTFHDFHTSWVTHMKEALNGGVLPDGYYAMSEQHAGQAIPDVVTLSETPRGRGTPETGTIAVAEAPPRVALTMAPDENASYRETRRTLAIRHAGGHRIVALIEIVSPANKDRAASVQEFVEKAVSALSQGIHLLVVDLHAPGRSDPRGMHGAIWERFDADGYRPPRGKPLTLVSYAVDTLPMAYVEPAAVGDQLPDMPLFLQPGRYVSLPIEAPYEMAYGGMSRFWREVIEGRAEPPLASPRT